MRIQEILNEVKPSLKTCRKAAAGKNVGISARSSCVSRGLVAHQSKHTDGTGKQGVKGSGKKLTGKHVKGEKYGGPVKDYGA